MIDASENEDGFSVFVYATDPSVTVLLYENGRAKEVLLDAIVAKEMARQLTEAAEIVDLINSTNLKARR